MDDKKSVAENIHGKWMPSDKIPDLLKSFHRARDAPERQQRQAGNERGDVGRIPSMAEQEKLAPAYKPPPEWRQAIDRNHFDVKWLKLRREIAMSNAAAAYYAQEKQQQRTEQSHDHIPTLEPTR